MEKRKKNGNYYSIWVLYWDNGKENGNHYSILMETTTMGLYRDYRVCNYWGYVRVNGKENGNYYSIIGYSFWYALA